MFVDAFKSLTLSMQHHFIMVENGTIKVHHGCVSLSSHAPPEKHCSQGPQCGGQS